MLRAAVTAMALAVACGVAEAATATAPPVIRKGIVSIKLRERGALLMEDFEGLTLIDSDLESDDDDETDWNTVADSGLGALGWTMDPRTTPVAASNNEYYGWTVWDHTWWLNEQGDQAGRSQFLPELQPNNTMLGVDPDGHDDFVTVGANGFTAIVRSPEINVSGLAANSLALSFNSTWAEEDLQLAVGRHSPVHGEFLPTAG